MTAINLQRVTEREAKVGDDLLTVFPILGQHRTEAHVDGVSV